MKKSLKRQSKRFKKTRKRTKRRGTPSESKAYYNTSQQISKFIPDKVLQQTPNPNYKTQKNKNNFNSGR